MVWYGMVWCGVMWCGVMWCGVVGRGVVGWVVLTRTHNQFLSKNKKSITIFHLKMIFFTAVKYCSILNGHVFVMISVIL